MATIFQAIISNQTGKLRKLLKTGSSLHDVDQTGFSAEELARFFMREECLALISPNRSPRVFWMIPKGESHLKKYSQKELEDSLDFTYTPSLIFSSYDELKNIQTLCPWFLRTKLTADENIKLGQKWRDSFGRRETAPLYIKWINSDIGYGLFALETIPKGSYIGEYTGEVRKLVLPHPSQIKLDNHRFFFHYPTKYWSHHYHLIDALKKGSLIRFINHSETPNLKPECAVDRKVLHQIFFATKEIEKNEQLTFDYGKDYWQKRKKLPL